MNVKELKEALSKYPDNMDVFINEISVEFRYGSVNSVKSKTINFDDGDNPKAGRDKVVILSDEY